MLSIVATSRNYGHGTAVAPSTASRRGQNRIPYEGREPFGNVQILAAPCHYGERLHA